MPRRNDIKSILILGSGPIIIGQACEFDYSGIQACKALRQEDYRIILVNSNSATIMTDPDLADATYIEPVHWEVVANIIAKERPDALLPTMGGHTAFNCALDLIKEGILDKYKVEMLGVNKVSIDMAEDREQLPKVLQHIGLPVARSATAHNLEEADQIQKQIGFPAIIHTSSSIEDEECSIAYNLEEFKEICIRALELSPAKELTINESILGWKEFEIEIIRDNKDNCIIVCSIENLDPIGIHSGDSIIVAPAQTLTDKEYQYMRDTSIQILRQLHINMGAANVKFGINPHDRRIVVSEVTPRISRSSTLASKATGFPIAKITAKLAVGYTLDELRNDLTKEFIPSSCEPTLNYIVTKIPRFNFDKFPQAKQHLTMQMKSVGEVMAIGTNFQESLQKAIRSLEINRMGLDSIIEQNIDRSTFLNKLLIPSPDRLWYIADALRHGLTIEEIYQATHIDPWFLSQIQHLIITEKKLSKKILMDLSRDELLKIKCQGFSDAYLAKMLSTTESQVRAYRLRHNIKPVYKRIEPCAIAFSSNNTCLYSTYEPYCNVDQQAAKKIMIIGSGPNRIGQGIEFDYCCVHAVDVIHKEGYQTIMVNCNPDAVSTDSEISDRLYFEPVTLEDVLAIVDIEHPEGVVVHYGGKTPLSLACQLKAAGVPIIGTSVDVIDPAEDRRRFQHLIHKLQLKQPANSIVNSKTAALKIAKQLSYPLVARQLYVLGDQPVEVVHNEKELCHYLQFVVKVSNDAPLLLEYFLNDAIEVDVDAICDGKEVFIAGIMQHVEQAGIHSGDSAYSLPPFSLSIVIQQDLINQVTKIALELGVTGLMNVKFAIQDDDVYVLNVNLRASRSVPFVSKAIGIPIAKIAMKCKLGISLRQQQISSNLPMTAFYSIKLPVFSFDKFSNVDSILGPEMKSTGETMGIANSFGRAYAKGQLGAGINIKKRRKAFVSVSDSDKSNVGYVAKQLLDLGFNIIATNGTATLLRSAGIECSTINKVIQGQPHIVDTIKNDEVDFILNTTEGKLAIADSFPVRASALLHNVSHSTTLLGGQAVCLAMKYGTHSTVLCLQDLHAKKNTYKK